MTSLEVFELKLVEALVARHTSSTGSGRISDQEASRQIPGAGGPLAIPRIKLYKGYSPAPISLTETSQLSELSPIFLASMAVPI